MNVEVRHGCVADIDSWLAMRCALWPEGSAAEHRSEIDAFFAGGFPREPWAVLIARDDAGRDVGLAELSIRSYAEGCRSHRVAYLEGWFVADPANEPSVAAHRALGFTDVGLVRCFRKDL